VKPHNYKVGENLIKWTSFMNHSHIHDLSEIVLSSISIISSSLHKQGYCLN